MRKCIYMLFPEGRPKALTTSYDDGVVQDIRLMGILDKYGIKGTFNLNSGRISENEPETLPEWGILGRRSAVGLYKNSGHEVAVHSLTHPALEMIPLALAYSEILEDRKNLETLFGGIVRGMAYPQGTYSDEVVRCLKDCGIAYARTTEPSEGFSLPKDWLRLKPTCHHNHPRLMELAEQFVSSTPYLEPWLFYLWGHSYEFDTDHNWDRIEAFCQTVSGKDDVWYATNIEIYDYTMAYEGLKYAAAANLVYNPSVIPVWINYNDTVVKIESGAYAELN